MGWRYQNRAFLQATKAEMPRQLNPSILTGAGLFPPHLTRPDDDPPLPFFRDEGEAEDPIEGDSGLIIFPIPNCSSWIKGFEALTGGDPLKNGGDEAT